MAVKESAPELLEFVYSAYAQPSHLFCQDHVIKLSEGVQQGNPLGPLLRSKLKVFDLDDCTLGGSLEDVLCDLQFGREGSSSLRPAAEVLSQSSSAMT